MNRYGTVTSPVGAHLADPAALAAFAGHGGGGLVVGLDRYQAPVVLRAFRPEPTRIVVVGSIRCAQLLTLRAMGVGARVFVETARPDYWTDFAQRFAITAGEDFAVGPAGARPSGPDTRERPRLLVVDAGYTIAPGPTVTGGHQAVLVLREELTGWDVDLLNAADVVIMQRLTETEAGIATRALPLQQVQDWLPRVAPEMVAIAGAHGVRWAMLAPGPIERRLLTSVARDAPAQHGAP
jgi:hypothetical protein